MYKKRKTDMNFLKSIFLLTIVFSDSRVECGEMVDLGQRYLAVWKSFGETGIVSPDADLIFAPDLVRRSREKGEQQVPLNSWADLREYWEKNYKEWGGFSLANEEVAPADIPNNCVVSALYIRSGVKAKGQHVKIETVLRSLNGTQINEIDSTIIFLPAPEENTVQ